MHLPNNQLASGDSRFCFAHQAVRPEGGGCEIAPGEWIGASFWIKRGFRPTGPRAQNGAALFGLLLGVLLGLGLGIATAVAVSKVSRPFVGRAVPQEVLALEDQEEAIRDRGWDPNAPLRGSAPVAPVTAASVPAAPILVLGADVGAAEPQDSDDESESVDLYLYYVQAKAFNAREKAESFRTKILAAGQDALVVKRGGRFFVRMGPYPSREQAEGMKNDLATVGCECELVRVAQ